MSTARGSGISWNRDGCGTITDKPDDLATVSLHEIVKYANRLMFVLRELAASDQPANCGQGKAVAKLEKKVRRFLKDLDRSTESCDRLTELLIEYDGYWTEYYQLRNLIDRHRRSSLPSMKGTCSNLTAADSSCARLRSFVEKPDAAMSGPPCCDDAGRRLGKRQALLDVTKGSAVMDAGNVCESDSPDYVDRLCDWMSSVREYCFICLPCQLLAYLWFN